MEGVVDLRRLVSRREPDDVELNEKLAVWERSTTLTDLTVRTAARSRLKLYGRNYPSEKRPA
jgi:hypothetical protein